MIRKIKFLYNNFICSLDFIFAFALSLALWGVPTEILLMDSDYINEYSRAAMSVLSLLFTIYLAIITFNRDIINNIQSKHSITLNSEDIFRIFKILIYLIMVNVILLAIQDFLIRAQAPLRYEIHYKIVLPFTIYNLLASFSILGTIFQLLKYENKITP